MQKGMLEHALFLRPLSERREVGVRLMLRLADRGDYPLVGISTRAVPDRLPPGRGVTVDGAVETQVALLAEDESGQNQAVAHPLAKSFLELLGAAQVLYHAADEYAAKGAGAVGTMTNAAKYLASEAAFACADHAMQTFGGYSFAREYHIGRFWAESRLLRIAPVNNQMVLNYIAERELHLPRSY